MDGDRGTAIRRAPARPHDGSCLFLALTEETALARAFDKVLANGGAAGGDRVTVDGFARLARQRIGALSAALKAGTYQPGPIRRVAVPKPSGGTRTLSIPCVGDRVAQTSAAIALSPLLEEEFEAVSFGYRPGRSVKQALGEVQRHRSLGYTHTVEADIEAFFDNVPHDLLLARFVGSFGEGPLTDLVALWLETGAARARGLAQGSPLSPLLANLYLDALDERLLARGMRIVRYADDFVVLTKTRKGAEKALSEVRAALDGLGLHLHPSKTRARTFEEAVRFLGATFVRSFVLRDDPMPFETEMDSLLADLARRERDAEEAAQAAESGRAKETAAGYVRRVRTLYLHEPGRALGLANLALTVRERPVDDARGELLAAVHPTQLDRIELGPQAETDAETLRNALAFGLTVHFVNGHGEIQGTLAPPSDDRGLRQLAQARHCLEPDLRLALARRFVDARLRNARALLRRINQRRQVQDVARRAVAVGRHVRLAERAVDLDELRGHEGSGSAHYWKGFSGLLMHGWSLATRSRPATDPVNAVLNVLASLLEREVRIALERAGLHPSFGTLHATSDGRDACVYDLMEVFRAPVAESVVLDLFNTRVLRPEHFEPLERTQRLTRSGFAAIIRGFEERMESVVRSPIDGRSTTWRGIIDEQARDLAGHVEGRASFSPYLMDY